MRHRLTPVQKRILLFMLDASQPVVFVTGHKTSSFEADFIVYCQSTVWCFLKFHGYIYEPNANTRRWELTEKGIAAVAGCKRSPSKSHVVGTDGTCVFCKRQAARDLEARA